MDKRAYAVTSVLLGIAMGVIGNLFFNQKLLGISFPLFIGIAFVALFGFAQFAGSPTRLRSMWLAIPLVFFAAMVAVRAELTITVLNILAVFWLGSLLLHYRRAPEGIDQQSLFQQVGVVFTTSISTLVDPLLQLIDTRGWMREVQPFRGTGVRSVRRGLVLSMPILGVFGLLLASADMKFSQYATEVLSLFRIQDVDGILSNGIAIVGIGWICCGALAYSVLARPVSKDRFVQIGDAYAIPLEADPPAPSQDDHADPTADRKPRKKHQFVLGMVESGMVLGSVNLLFGAFVVIQFAYFFGGQQNISLETGWSYSQYARRGFFELVAVSVLTLGLILWLDWVTVRSNTTQHTIFRALSIAIVAFTGVMLVSAHLRLELYEQRDGFTHLRLYTHVFMAWMGILFAIFIIYLFRSHTQIFSLGVTLCIIGYLVTMNFVNADAMIASKNIVHGEIDQRELDIPYLRLLSTDAVPVVLPYYLQMEESREKTNVGNWLYQQWIALDQAHANDTIFSAHISRQIAWQVLSEHASLLTFKR